jgi:hypothetical protein
LLLSQVQENPSFFITNIRNVTAWSTSGSMFNSGSFQRISLQIEQVWKKARL